MCMKLLLGFEAGHVAVVGDENFFELFHLGLPLG